MKKRTLQPADLPIEQQIVAAIRQIMRAVDLHSRRLVENCGLTGPQLAILEQARRLAPASPSSIARAVHLSQGTVTGVLHRLEHRGLITRRRNDSDRRAIIVDVTEEGIRLLEQAPSLLQDRFRSELERLDGWERLMILSTLQRVAGLMGASGIDASPYLVTGSMHADRTTSGNGSTTDDAPGSLREACSARDEARGRPPS